MDGAVFRDTQRNTPARVRHGKRKRHTNGADVVLTYTAYCPHDHPSVKQDELANGEKLKNLIKV